ncbi:MAG: xanthine dehydrogenase family protein subunit M [Thermodesulfobacteriota bacterium]|nr:xanthine dehydrogenase family protein subunit M [Thermodesulfobacteriota bacterium]
MTLSRFEYLAPETVEEACMLLKKKGDKAAVMAGGTDLLIKIRHHLSRPDVIIGLKKIRGLDRISFDKKQGLTIGASALLSDVASHPYILKKYPAIAYAAQETATVQIRNMGTVGGNLCNAAPSADNAPTLIAMNAEISLVGPKGQRQLPLDQFFIAPGLTVMEEGEVLTSIFVPLPPPSSGVVYKHISARGKVDISAVGIGTMLIMNGDICNDARIVLGAVAPVPMRALKTEKLIKGKKLTRRLAERAGIQASKESSPITDARATAEYRRSMVAVLTKRALIEAGKRGIKK